MAARRAAAVAAARVNVAVVIGASTGGPKALGALLAGLPPDLPAYVFVVQHIHARFSPALARHLAREAGLPVEEAAHGVLAEPGRAYVAPGGRHLGLRRTRAGAVVLRLEDGPPVHGVRPSVDPLLIAAARLFEGRVVAVVLTGMGRDGLEGAGQVKQRGGIVLAEAEESCVVYGMPRALADAGLADRLVPLGRMGAAVVRAVGELRKRDGRQ
jgi:two-component system chemotaxis response regulator CheB